MADEQIDVEKIRYLDVPLAVASLKPGDVVVIHSPRPLSKDVHDRLKAKVEEEFPGHKAMILCDGLKLGILSPKGEVSR